MNYQINAETGGVIILEHEEGAPVPEHESCTPRLYTLYTYDQFNQQTTIHLYTYELTALFTALGQALKNEGAYVPYIV